ncbi:MAG: HK97 gp10 family phage protein [Pikeienuella sp.]
MKSKFQIKGLDDVNELLGEIAPKHAKNIMRSTVHGVAGELRNSIKKKSPKDSGDLKRSEKTKRRRQKGSKIASDVLIGEFYWRFLEEGSGPDGVEHAMVMKTVAEYRASGNEVALRQYVKKLEAKIKREQKKAGG